MKIIHCADLHLDSKMTANLSREQARERRKEILRTFTRMVEYAAKHEVRVILIAGDLFDTRNVSAMVRNTVRDMICSHPFESQMSFSDPQQIIKTDDGEMPYGIFRYQQIIDESYIISKVIHTSYTDILDISIRERDRMIELINEENKRNQEDLDKLKAKSKR